PRAAAAAPARRGGRRPTRRRRRLALAIALAALLLAAVALAATGVIHFHGATIHRVNKLPPANPVPHLVLGTPIRIAEATRLVPAVRLPPRLSAPDAAYEDERGVNFVYLGPHGPRAILGVLREGPELLDKLVSLQT